MKQGDKVMIYQDLFTQKKPEGMARLVYCENENMGIYDGRLVQRWFVKFIGQRQGYSRSILIPCEPGCEFTTHKFHGKYCPNAYQGEAHE